MVGEILRDSIYTSRGSAEYRMMLFPEDPTGNWLGNWILRNQINDFHRTRFTKLHLGPNFELIKEPVTLKQIKKFSGGINNLFSRNSTVLDMGSGTGKATSEFGEIFKLQQARIIGLDIDYPVVIPIDLSHGYYLSGDWRKLPFKNNSISGILGNESFPRYDFSQHGNSVIKEVTRIAKPDAIWRATLPFDFSGIINALGGVPYESGNDNETLAHQLLGSGWEVVIGGRIFIAKLTYKS